MTFSDACVALEQLLSARAGIVEEMIAGKASDPFARLHDAMRKHTFGNLSLKSLVQSLDAKCRSEGLHLMQAWDFKAHKFAPDPAPALLVEHCMRLERRTDARTSLAVLLDVYFCQLLSLLAARAWDEGDASSNLDRVTLLIHLTEREGSGLRYVDDAETLLFLAASYFHPDERSYDLLLERVRQLPMRQQQRMAASSGAMLSAHLRWGFRYMYDRDIKRMRDDNAADYPWVRWAVDTLARGDNDEALLVAVAADPWEMVARIEREGLREKLQRIEPQRGSFSPLSVTFNFPSNAGVALVASTLEDGRFYPSLNALFAGEGSAQASELAERLMRYSTEPKRLRAGGVPLVVHDPTEAARAFNQVQRAIA